MGDRVAAALIPQSRLMDGYVLGLVPGTEGHDATGQEGAGRGNNIAIAATSRSPTKNQ